MQVTEQLVLCDAEILDAPQVSAQPVGEKRRVGEAGFEAPGVTLGQGQHLGEGGIIELQAVTGGFAGSGERHAVQDVGVKVNVGGGGRRERGAEGFGHRQISSRKD